MAKATPIGTNQRKTKSSKLLMEVTRREPKNVVLPSPKSSPPLFYLDN